MEISFSPNEILVNIASFLTLKDAKSLLLSSKLMYEISKTCIRTAPRLKRMLSVQSLLTLAHLPIHQLWTTDLLVKDLTGEEALEQMVKMWGFIVDTWNLFVLCIDLCCFAIQNYGMLQEDHIRLLCSELQFETVGKILRFVEILESINIKTFFLGDDRLLSLEQFRRLYTFPIDKVPIQALDIRSADDVGKFMGLLYHARKQCVMCKIILGGGHGRWGGGILSSPSPPCRGNPESSSHAQSIKYLLGDLVSSGNSESTIGL